MRVSILALLMALLSAGAASARNGGDTRLAGYFRQATPGSVTPDTDGFIRRWLVLEPIENGVKTNVLFTDSWLREAFGREYYKGQGTLYPHDGLKVKADGKKLQWHALDSELFNVKLFRFATNLGLPHYGVLFEVVTTIVCDEEIKDVRLSAGSNSASMWWLDGEEALLLAGDRRMVADDGMSRRLTLRKGRNILRGLIINGPGMSDFCVRFIDSKGRPVTNYKIEL